MYKKILAFLGSLISCFLFEVEPIHLHASNSGNVFNGYSGENQITNEVLEESTNTIKFTNKNYEESNFDYISTGEIVGGDVGITILTHGLGANASHWSNDTHYGKSSNLDFVYDSNSMIEQLRLITNGDVYLANFNSGNSFYLYKLPDLKEYETQATPTDYNNVKYSSSWEEITKITEINKHMIVIFQSSDPGSTNDFVYSELNFLIDKIVYDYKYLNNDVLPRINLISHSRGGITNLQYAMDHPHLVNQMFTIASPFLGSKLGNVSFIMDMLGLDATDPNNGEYDIMNEETSLGYRERWNNNYHSLYSNIDVHAIGAYVNIDYVYKLLLEDIFLPNYIEPKLGISTEQFRKIVSLLSDLYIEKNLADFVSKENLVNFIVNIIYKSLEIGENSDLYNLIETLVDVIKVDENGELIILDDLFIDLESQLGDGYLGFIQEPILFTDKDSDFTRLSAAQPAVAHNIEARNKKVISYVMQNLYSSNMPSNTYVTTEKNDGTLKIDFAYGIQPTNEKLYIPSSINGKTVTEIGDYAFSNYNYEVGLLEVYIPNTITKIGKNAFLNCDFIETISFQENSNLEIVDYGAFQNCTNLLNISLPNSVIEIKELAFSNCVSLHSFDLPYSLVDIYSNSFYNCESLESLYVENNNQLYQTLNGVLFSKNGAKLVIYPCGKNDETFVVPSTVDELLEYAFNGNQNIQILNLSNTKILREKALFNCSNLHSIYSLNLEGSFDNALLCTEWYENQIIDVKLGRCYIDYKGDDDIISQNTFDGIISIGNKAFEQSDIKEIVIPQNIETIYSKAFCNTKSLEKVYLLGNSYIYNDAFNNTNSDLKVFVTEKSFDAYIDSPIQNYLCTLCTNVYINYDDNCFADIFNYGESYELPTIEKSGYTTNWYDNNGLFYEQNGIWNRLEEQLYLSPVFEENVKFIKDGITIFDYDLKDGDYYSFIDNMIYINGELVSSLEDASRFYEYVYTINGNQTISGIYDNSFKNVIITEEPIEYEVDIYSYKIEHINTSNDPTSIIYTYEDILLHGINFFTPGNTDEYLFDGLYLDSNCVNKLNSVYQIIGDNIQTLYVKWKPVEYIVYYYYEYNNKLISTEIVYAHTPHFILPEINEIKNYYYCNGWVEEYSNDIVLEGDSYTITGDTIFYINWIPVNYTITYENTFEVINPNRTSYNVETPTFNLSNNLIRQNYEFLGWYTDIYFSNKIEKIVKGTHTNLVLYGKWKATYTFNRTGTITVTDNSNVWSNYYDNISLITLTGYTAEELKRYGYSSITVNFSLYIWEDKDGYQQIFIYNGNNSNSIKLFEVEIEHGPNKKDETEKLYSFSVSLSIDDMIDSNSFVIAYSARGIGNDDWKNRNLSVEVTSVQTKAIHDHHYNYLWKSLTSHNCICDCGYSMISGHAVKQGDLNGQNTAKCLLCGGEASIGFVGTMSINQNIVYTSTNGSYILPNGIIVLMDEDIGGFLDGTLIFYNITDELM